MRKSLKEIAFDFRVKVGYTSAFILLLISYILTLYGNSQLMKQTAWIKHTNKVIRNLDGLASGMKDAETGLRGYINTKDSSFLLPYKNSFAIVDTNLTDLITDTKDNEHMQNELANLASLITARYDKLLFDVDYYSQNNYAVNDSLLQSFYKGKIQMDSIRAIVNRLQVREQNLLDLRTKELDSKYVALNTIIITSLVLALIFAVFGFYAYRREYKTRLIADKRGDVADERGDVADKRGDVADKRGDVADKRGDDYLKQLQQSNVELDKANIRGDVADKRGDVADKRGDHYLRQLQQSNVELDKANIRGDVADKRGDVADKRGDDYLKQLQQRVRELDKANMELLLMKRNEKFAATGRIARSIAHEVRNPLTNIDLAVAQIKSDMPVQDENSNMLFDMVIRNSKRINQLVTELLSATRFVELNYISGSVNTLLDEALGMANDRIELNHIRIEKNYGNGMSDISVDREKIKIAFLNLIVNAIEAMEPNRGILQIHTRAEEDNCVIEITDNGSGMTEEHLNKLFEPYFTTKTNGNGLGLTNTQNIILNHKGYISVSSKPDEGTTFVIRFGFVIPS